MKVFSSTASAVSRATKKRKSHLSTPSPDVVARTEPAHPVKEDTKSPHQQEHPDDRRPRAIAPGVTKWVIIDYE